MVREAMLYDRLEEGVVQCRLCAHRCRIRPGERGVCGVRENRDGVLVSLVYGRAVAAAVDPIEKKPLYHFLPGSESFSIATVGCNFRCLFCQNADISQAPREGRRWEGWVQELLPGEVVRLAQRYGCASIAYTYTEPTVFFEYAYDTAVLAAEAGLRNVFVTNGYMTPEALERLEGVLHAANVDLKGDDAFYRKICGGRQAPVMESIRLMREMGVWVEVTTLVIPGYNDGEEVLRSLAEFVASVGEEVPWHVSRFIPRYKLLNAPPTPVETIHRAVEIGYQSGLRYVYAGNVPGDPYEDTLCPMCGAVVIQRVGYRVENRLVEGNRCPQCGAEVAVVV